jgi:hypothetical protein
MPLGRNGLPKRRLGLRSRCNVKHGEASPEQWLRLDSAEAQVGFALAVSPLWTAVAFDQALQCRRADL